MTKNILIPDKTVQLLTKNAHMSHKLDHGVQYLNALAI